MEYKGIILKAKQGEINFLWADLTHVVKDIETGAKFAVSGRVLEDNGFAEGDIIIFGVDMEGEGSYQLKIKNIEVPINLN